MIVKLLTCRGLGCLIFCEYFNYGVKFRHRKQQVVSMSQAHVAYGEHFKRMSLAD